MTEEQDHSTKELQRQRAYASLANPTIYAAVKSLYSFANLQQAERRLTQIKHDFVTSKQSEIVTDANAIIIWIAGFEVSKEEKSAGYKGNFAILKSAPKEDDRFTISATKLFSDLKLHPQRRLTRQKHPNWGNPILRDIKKQRLYFSLEEVDNELRACS